MYLLPDDDSQRVETCWIYYVLNFKYKFTLSHCAFNCLLRDSLRYKLKSLVYLIQWTAKCLKGHLSARDKPFYLIIKENAYFSCTCLTHCRKLSALTMLSVLRNSTKSAQKASCSGWCNLTDSNLICGGDTSARYFLHILSSPAINSVNVSVIFIKIISRGHRRIFLLE
jgi:hypothetical protein